MYAIKNSSTLILPEQLAILNHLAQVSKEKGKTPLSSCMMPRDIATCWNSTYEMLSFAYTYRDTYNEITSNRDMKMRKYELLDSDWKIINDLASVLKVNNTIYNYV